jgi:hypothetical protein
MATQNIYSLVDVWNSAGTTFTGIGLNVTDTASASGSLLLNLQVGGLTQLNLTKNGVLSVTNSVVSNYFVPQIHVGFTGGSNLAGATGNAIEQRNSTNAQTFRVYNTYTDASNYERGLVGWVSNQFSIRTQAGGSGTPRQLTLGTDSSAAGIQFVTNNTDRWFISGTGHLTASTDNTYDIGALGATRPRNVYAGSVIVAGSWFETGTGGGYLFTGRGGIASSADGIVKLRNAADTDFSRLQFGGTTSSFPSLKRNGAQLDVRLADDSGDASIACNSVVGSGFLQGTRLRIVDGVSAPAAATGYAQIYVDTADGDLKIIFADGTIKTIVTDT